MIVWSGRGILIVVILIATLFLGFWIFPEHMAGHAFVFAGLVTAIFCWLAGIAWNVKSDRIFIDEETGERILIKGGGHNLFWIPMQYWSIILTVLSIIILVQYSIWQTAVVAGVFCTIVIIQIIKRAERNRNQVEPIHKMVEPIYKNPEVKITEPEEKIAEPTIDKEDHSRFMPK